MLKQPDKFCLSTAYQFTNPVKDKVNDFLANSVMTAGIVVRSVFFASYQLFRMEELAISSSADLI